MGRQSSILSFFSKPISRTPSTAPTPRDGSSNSQGSSDASSPVGAKRVLFSQNCDGENGSPSVSRQPSHLKPVPSIAQDDDDDLPLRPSMREKQKRDIGVAHALPESKRARMDSCTQKRKLRRFVDDDAESMESDLITTNGIDTVGVRGGSTAEVEHRYDDSEVPFLAFTRGSAPRTGVPHARSRLDALDMTGGHTEEEGGWCDKNSWSVKVRDSARRTPDHPEYDPSTLYVPRNVLEKMSPFQKQYWELKSRYYNTMLFVKKGAFMEAYDIDADIVHKELGLNYTGGGRAQMRCAGVPEYSLNRHAARLIDLGYRVGIVAQTETANAADKRKVRAATGGTSTSKVCHRSLVRILTRATVTDDDLLMDHRARYVVALLEADQDSASPAGDVLVGVCHVDAASGRVTVGEFLDDNRRSWSEKLLSTLKPPELIVPGESTMSPRMRGLVRWVSTGSSVVDIIHVDEIKGFPAMTASWLEEYTSTNPHSAADNSPLGRLPEYLQSHNLASKTLGAIASYLRDLKIDREILSLGNYTLLPSAQRTGPASQPSMTGPGSTCTGGGSDSHPPGQLSPSNSLCGEKFASDESFGGGYDPTRVLGGGLQMDAATIANLEVVSNVVDGSETGTLISILDRAATPSGRRLLRRWVSDPLSNSAAINDRLNAVETLLNVEDTAIDKVRKLLRSGPDVERALARLHQFAVVEDVAVMFDDTNARRVKEFVKVLRSLQTTIDGLELLKSALPQNCLAKRLSWLVSPGHGYSESTRADLDYFLESCFDVSLAEKEGEMAPKAGGSRRFDTARATLDEIQAQLYEELHRWQRKLGDKSIKFYNRGKETFQLEVKHTTLEKRGVPSLFTPTSESKGAKRFYTHVIQDLVKHHVDASEAFSSASVNVLRDVVASFDDKREIWTSVVKVASEVDALIGLALASQEDGSGPMVRPIVLADEYPHAVFEAEQLRHPVLAAKAGASFVSNDSMLGDGKDTVVLLTGSNCSGKSTLSRQVAVAVILAQLGAYVPAKSIKLRPFKSLFARAGSRDEIARGRSTFMVEMEEAALIANTASDRSLVIVDELCSGTTAQDAHAVSHAMLDHLLKLGCLTVFCTHADALALEFDGRVGNFTMAADVDEDQKTIVFLYKMVRGITSHSRGVFCARVAGVPPAVADHADELSRIFDGALAARREATKSANLVCDLTKASSTQDVCRLLASLKA